MWDVKGDLNQVILEAGTWHQLASTLRFSSPFPGSLGTSAPLLKVIT
jgi:hypothetical protein